MKIQTIETRIWKCFVKRSKISAAFLISNLRLGTGEVFDCSTHWVDPESSGMCRQKGYETAQGKRSNEKALQTSLKTQKKFYQHSISPGSTWAFEFVLALFVVCTYVPSIFHLWHVFMHLQFCVVFCLPRCSTYVTTICKEKQSGTIVCTCTYAALVREYSLWRQIGWEYNHHYSMILEGFPSFLLF